MPLTQQVLGFASVFCPTLILCNTLDIIHGALESGTVHSGLL